MRPTAENVSIEQAKGESEVSGLLLSNNAIKNPNKGTVIAIGGDVTDVAVGDVVIYSEFMCTELLIDNKNYILTNQKQIHLIL